MSNQTATFERVSYSTLPQDELQQNESSSFEIISNYSG